MLARSTELIGRSDGIDRGLAFIRDEVRPAVEGMPGCVGMSCLVDRRAGRCISTTAWEDEGALRASESRVGELRERGAMLFGSQPQVRYWEIGLLHRVRAVPDGAWARVTWTRMSASGIDDSLEIMRDVVLHQLEDIPGFCSCSLLVDRSTGAGALATTYESEDALEESRHAAMSLRTDATGRMAADVLEIAEMEVAFAHLRVPETV